jgi:hypothetical protein
VLFLDVRNRPKVGYIDAGRAAMIEAAKQNYDEYR